MAQGEKLVRYIFSAGESIRRESFVGIIEFVESFPVFYDVVLDNEHELEILLNLIGLSLPIKETFEGNNDFEALYDISNQNMKDFSKDGFDSFYDEWIKETQRQNTMDEYGQLIFIYGQANSWNKMLHKFILQEKA